MRQKIDPKVATPSRTKDQVINSLNVKYKARINMLYDSLAEIRDILLGSNTRDPIYTKWLKPCSERSVHVTDLCRDRMYELRNKTNSFWLTTFEKRQISSFYKKNNYYGSINTIQLDNLLKRLYHILTSKILVGKDGNDVLIALVKKGYSYGIICVTYDDDKSFTSIQQFKNYIAKLTSPLYYNSIEVPEDLDRLMVKYDNLDKDILREFKQEVRDFLDF